MDLPGQEGATAGTMRIRMRIQLKARRASSKLRQDDLRHERSRMSPLPENIKPVCLPGFDLDWHRGATKFLASYYSEAYYRLSRCSYERLSGWMTGEG